MKENLRERLATLILASIVGVIIVGGLIIAYPNYRRGQKLRQRHADLQYQIREKKRQIEKLVENQRRFRVDAEFVEAIARQNHRVYPGELVFIFEDD